ncbi:MAG: sulfatase, partial [Candidatus Omnitrophica bacterium]|nr:sulfatase [Candidatus Omnitrophota bacterium]
MKAILRNPLLRLLLIALIATSSLVLIARIGSLFMGKNPVVLLITADSLRPDHLSCYGYGPISTKSLDELAEDGVLFENAYCSVPARIYSYAAVLTGKNGGTATVAKGGTVRLNDLCRSLSEYLRNEGYLTIAVTSDPVLAKDAGFGRDFDIVENVPPGAPETRDDQTDAEKNLTQTALELLWKNKRKPVFMWLEYPIPLFPYQVPENFRKARDQHLYDRQIVLLDGKISMLLRGMRELGLDKAATIVFTAANGESLNEHKEFTRGIFVYDSTARVPLIIKSPKCPPGKRVKTIASHIDIAPTILAELGINYDPRNFDGESLVPVIADEKDAEPRSLYIESPIGYHAFGWSPVVGLISDDHKYIELPKPELYDLKKDPHELHNIVNE